MKKTLIYLFTGLLAVACFDNGQKSTLKNRNDVNRQAQDSEQTCGQNPYLGKTLPVNPFYQDRVNKNTLPLVAGSRLETPVKKLTQTSTAVWIDKINSLDKLDPAIKSAKAASNEAGIPSQLTVVVYNLPVRDCAAYASNGELGEGDMERYKHEFIDAIASKMEDSPDQFFSVILEVDSLPNMVSNLNVPNCVKAAPLYKEGVAYAIKQFQLPNVSIYLDVAHAGWLGWKSNQKKMATIFKELLDSIEGPASIRGFASNVSNYTPLQRDEGAEKSDPYYAYNDALDELSFVSQFREELENIGITGKGFIIDTSRNGVNKPRDVWGHWCNVKGAGLGRPPTISPDTKGLAQCVDAYLWIKPPGESDGTTDSNSSRYDQMCSFGKQNAPEAGEWFHDHLIDMIENASPQFWTR